MYDHFSVYSYRHRESHVCVEDSMTSAACQLTLSTSFETAAGPPLAAEVGDQICPPCRGPIEGFLGQLHCSEARPAQQPPLTSAVDINHPFI